MSKILKKIIVAAVLFLGACSSGHNCNPDAFQRNWVWAWDGYADAWCTWYQGCDPTGFANSYMDHARCAADNDDLCDPQLGYVQCHEAYPDNRLEQLAKCESDMRSLSCAAELAPDSCGQALTP